MTFELTKTLGVLTDPVNMWAVLAVLCVIVMLVARGVWRARAVGVLGFLALIPALMLVFPLGQWALEPLENLYTKSLLPDTVDGIVVLTGDENPQISEARGLSVTGHAGQRYLMLAKLARTYPNAKIVIVGDTVPLFPSHALTTQALISPVIAALGIPKERVRYETLSRNTHENARNTMEMMAPQKKEKWLLVTSAFHMPRAMLCFAHEGWALTPVSADYLTDGNAPLVQARPNLAHQLRLLFIAAHEYRGLMSYRLMGWTDRMWP